MVTKNKSLKGTVSTAAEGISAGASDAREKARELVPAAQELIGRSIYRTCYVVSFGVVFPTALLASFLPTDNALGHGLIDGARAARSAVDEGAARRAARSAARKARKAEDAVMGEGVEALSPA